VTALRPEHDGAGYGPPYGEEYGGDGLGAAVDRLADPLNDPLPGRPTPSWAQEPGAAYDPYAAQQGAPGQQEHQGPQEWYDPEGYRRDWYGQQQAPEQQAPVRPQGYVEAQPQAYVQEPLRQEFVQPQPVDQPTFALPTVERAPRRRIAEPERVEPERMEPERVEPEGGGRAARRRAARGRPQAKSGGRSPAKKESTGVVVSRFVGELFITFGVVMLLFVTYQLWWTNVRAGMQADGATNSLQDGWKKGGAKPKAAGVFEPGQGFAIMHIPKLDVKVPVAEGIDKHKVLDRGMVGHYADGKLKTAMPSDRQGNFSVAGHRNTHGEPFRYVNRLVKGDKIVVETQDAFYTYEMTSMLPQTSPSNVGVIQPVPPGSGFTAPGRYITLTTCTPEFTSTYRLIVWGKMVDERPRSKGMPPALGN
jgi:sortase A